MNADRSRHGARRVLAVAVSLAFHVAAFWLLWQKAQRLPLAPRPPVQITLREPPPPPTRKTPLSKAPPPIVAKTAVAAPAPSPQQPTEPEVTPTPEPAPFVRRQVAPGAGGALIVPWGDHGGHTDHIDPQHKDVAADNARVQKRLDDDIEVFQVQLDTQTGARGTVAELKHAIAARFAPHAEWVQSIPRSAAAQEQKTRNLFDAKNRPQGTSEFARAQTPGARQLAQQMGVPDLFDACAASHEIGRLEARVRVTHDAAGQGKNAELVRSSGSEVYDKYAEETVLAASATALASMHGEAIPIYSEWSLAQVVYDWYSTTALGCPPASHPPGRPVDPKARDPWGITYTNDITLAAVRYKHSR